MHICMTSQQMNLVYALWQEVAKLVYAFWTCKPVIQGSQHQGKSGKTREKIPSEKSWNFNIFYRESGKVRDNDLAEMNQILSLISKHIFVNTQWLQVIKNSWLRLELYAIHFRLPRGQENSLKIPPKYQGKSGISN